MLPAGTTVAAEVSRLAACETSAAMLTPLARYEACYVEQPAACAFRSQLLLEQDASDDTRASRFPGCRHLLPFGMFGLALHMWLRRGGFKPANVLLMQQESLLLHTDVALDVVHRFLGLSAHRTPMSFRSPTRALPPLLAPNESEELRLFFEPHRAYLRELVGIHGEAANTTLVLQRDFLSATAIDWDTLDLREVGPF